MNVSKHVLVNTAILAGDLASEVAIMTDREQNLLNQLEQIHEEAADLRRFKSSTVAVTEQLIGLAFPYDPSRPTSSVSPIPTATDCISQIRRKLDQSRRDRESVEHYQQVVEGQKIDLVAAASAIREAREMLVNDQSSIALRKSLAERLMATLVQITRPG